MRRVPVDSSSIASIGYAPEQRVLELEFRQSGEVYQYFDVPAEEHTAFLAADSKGTYLNLHFKPRQHRYHRVRPQQEYNSAINAYLFLGGHRSNTSRHYGPQRTVTFLRSGGDPENV